MIYLVICAASFIIRSVKVSDHLLVSRVKLICVANERGYIIAERYCFFCVLGIFGQAADDFNTGGKVKFFFTVFELIIDDDFSLSDDRFGQVVGYLADFHECVGFIRIIFANECDTDRIRRSDNNIEHFMLSFCKIIAYGFNSFQLLFGV